MLAGFHWEWGPFALGTPFTRGADTDEKPMKPLNKNYAHVACVTK